jgi:hypothetical protein
VTMICAHNHTLNYTTKNLCTEVGVMRTNIAGDSQETLAYLRWHSSYMYFVAGDGPVASDMSLMLRKLLVIQKSLAFCCW